jgi:hypothetical protein
MGGSVRTSITMTIPAAAEIRSGDLQAHFLTERRARRLENAVANR